jgi:hypothetical protein
MTEGGEPVKQRPTGAKKAARAEAENLTKNWSGSQRAKRDRGGGGTEPPIEG